MCESVSVLPDPVHNGTTPGVPCPFTPDDPDVHLTKVSWWRHSSGPVTYLRSPFVSFRHAKIVVVCAAAVPARAKTPSRIAARYFSRAITPPLLSCCGERDQPSHS